MRASKQEERKNLVEQQANELEFLTRSTEHPWRMYASEWPTCFSCENYEQCLGDRQGENDPECPVQYIIKAFFRLIDALETGVNLPDWVLKRSVNLLRIHSCNQGNVFESLVHKQLSQFLSSRMKENTVPDEIIEKTMNRLALLLDDEYEQVRRTAIWLIDDLGGQKAVKHLITAVYDTSFGISYFATETLGKIGNDEAVRGLQALFLAVDTSIIDHRIYKLAAKSLYSLGHETGLHVQTMLDFLVHPKSSIRHSGFEAFEYFQKNGASVVQLLSIYFADHAKDLETTVLNCFTDTLRTFFERQTGIEDARNILTIKTQLESISSYHEEEDCRKAAMRLVNQIKKQLEVVK
ncbi:MAG: HEAT repeat domain-containing protein [Candidatus Odinarchaeota archaeon]